MLASWPGGCSGFSVVGQHHGQQHGIDQHAVTLLYVHVWYNSGPVRVARGGTALLQANCHAWIPTTMLDTDTKVLLLQSD
jgi:hypothetical protein